jgi:hypothetical protein
MEAPDRIGVRGWYQLKNTGTKPLEAIDLDLPDLETFAPQDMRIVWRGKALPEASAVDASGNTRMPLGASWELQGGGELVITYNLEISTGNAGADSAHGRAFFLPNAGWYPVLLPAQGLLGTGGIPPAKWDLSVSVPEGYRVHASGDKIVKNRSKEKNAASAGLVFEQRPGVSFEPFVAAGPYVEQEVQSAAGPVLLWTAQPVAAKRASEIGRRVGSDINFFLTEFGAQDAGKRTTWIIGCVYGKAAGAAEPRLSQTSCLTAPNSAVVSADFFGPAAPQKAIEDVDLQLAETWLQFPVQRARLSPLFPLSAIQTYAEFALNSSENPSSRDPTVRDLLRRVAAFPNPEKTLITVDEKDPPEVIERGQLQSELFFIALEDRCGARNLHQAIARASRVLRGQTWGPADLRSAVEAECGGPVLEGFFREWMHGKGVPADFRARYLGAAAVKLDE